MKNARRSHSYYRGTDGEFYIDGERDAHYAHCVAELRRLDGVVKDRTKAYEAASDAIRERDALQVELDHAHQIIIDLYLTIENGYPVEGSNAYHKAGLVYLDSQQDETEFMRELNEDEKQTWPETAGERI